MKKIIILLTTIYAFLTFIANLSVFSYYRKSEDKQDRKLYIALMLGGFVWSQLQTEYLIWRINKNTNSSLHHSEH
jgi:hypothetical protein